jgi:uncharacterized membrane protein (DUF4010 family)
VSAASLAGLLIAALGGAAIGLERQWSGHASGPQARFGGIRTFTMLGGVGGLCGLLSSGDLRPLAVVLLAGAAAVVAIGYATAARADIDGTTEVAALVVLAAGTLAGSGRLALSSGVIAVTALLLLEKTRLHALVARIDDASLRASARFTAMACVVLPLLPAGSYGPYGAIRPRELWALVLFFSGLSFAAWIAQRLAGPHAGRILSGLLGGIISSTSVTLGFARDSRLPGAPGLALAGGAVGACTVMLARVVVACAVLNPPLALALPRYIWPAFAFGLVTVLVAWRGNADGAEAEAPLGSPLQLRAALQMTALFQGVLFLILAVRSRWGTQALAGTAAFVGLTDLDALTLSLARSTTEDAMVPEAAMALVVGIVSNTLLKLGTTLAVGRGVFRVVTGAVLAAMAAATAAMLAAA